LIGAKTALHKAKVQVKTGLLQTKLKAKTDAFTSFADTMIASGGAIMALHGAKVKSKANAFTSFADAMTASAQQFSNSVASPAIESNTGQLSEQRQMDVKYKLSTNSPSESEAKTRSKLSETVKIDEDVGDFVNVGVDAQLGATPADEKPNSNNRGFTEFLKRQYGFMDNELPAGKIMQTNEPDGNKKRDTANERGWGSSDSGSMPFLPFSEPDSRPRGTPAMLGRKLLKTMNGLTSRL